MATLVELPHNVLRGEELDRLGLRLQQVEVVVGGARQAEVQGGLRATVHQPRLAGQVGEAVGGSSV